MKAEKKTGYKFAGWKVTSPADVSVTFEDANAEETTFTMPKITSGTLTIQGVFEVDPAYLSPDCEADQSRTAEAGWYPGKTGKQKWNHVYD